MVITILVLVVTLVFVLFLLWFEPWRQPDPHGTLQPISVPALMNLIDARNVQFLKLSLPPAEFRKARRERIRVLRIYVHRIAYNTRVLMTAAEAAQRALDPNTAASGRVLLSAALATRSRALMALGLLYAGELFPNWVPDLTSAIHTYESATARLATLHTPPATQP